MRPLHVVWLAVVLVGCSQPGGRQAASGDSDDGASVSHAPVRVLLHQLMEQDRLRVSASRYASPSVPGALYVLLNWRWNSLEDPDAALVGCYHVLRLEDRDLVLGKGLDSLSALSYEVVFFESNQMVVYIGPSTRSDVLRADGVGVPVRIEGVDDATHRRRLFPPIGPGEAPPQLSVEAVDMTGGERGGGGLWTLAVAAKSGRDVAARGTAEITVGKQKHVVEVTELFLPSRGGSLQGEWLDLGEFEPSRGDTLHVSLRLAPDLRCANRHEALHGRPVCCWPEPLTVATDVVVGNKD